MVGLRGGRVFTGVHRIRPTIDASGASLPRLLYTTDDGWKLNRLYLVAFAYCFTVVENLACLAVWFIIPKESHPYSE
jgi:hypothetical protein